MRHPDMRHPDMRHPDMPRTPTRGIALVIVLWTVTLLAVIAGSFTMITGTETKLIRNRIANAEAQALAEAGVYRAVLAMLGPNSEDRWRPDGRVYAFSFGGGEVRISIQDEGGKIDLNRGADAFLAGLFATVGLDERDSLALVDAIADFRDRDRFHRLQGAEDDDYFAAGLSYGAKDGPFVAVEELHQVMGMTAELYRRVAPFLTVYSSRSSVDPMVAPAEVLLAVPGIVPEQVDYLLALRAVAGEMGGVEAWLPLTSVEGYFSPLKPDRPIYTVRAEAHTGDGAVFVREAVVQIDRNKPQPFGFEAWRQGDRQ